MKKFLNQPEHFIDEMLEGLYAAYPNELAPAADHLRSLCVKHPVKGKVGIATGGGSGHLPLFLGYVGSGMLDGCAVGDVFQSPSAEEMLNVTKAVDQGQGVLYIYGNYNGDIFNFKMAADMADMEADITVKQIIAGDDAASGPRTAECEKSQRRGVAGIFFVYKVAGAAAAMMKSLDEVYAAAQKAAQQVSTMGVALAPCTVPRIGKPSFTIGDADMEIGMGIHGEAGIRRGPIKIADEIVTEIITPLVQDLQLQSGDECAVLINGLGATPLEEQFVVNRKVHALLKEQGIHVWTTYVGEYATSLEMTGMSISLMKLDEEMKTYLSAEANTPFFKQFKKESQT